MRKTFLVTYDICVDRRLANVHKTMRGFGDHLQYSVFECQLNQADLPRCRHLLSQIIDHREDHFHAEYGEHEALIQIESLAVYAGSLPNRALALVREWATCIGTSCARTGRWLEPAECPARSLPWSRIPLWASFEFPA